MPLLVTYTHPDDQALGLKALGNARIECEVRTAEDDAGIPITEVHVPDDQFDRACDIIEELEALIARERQEIRKIMCPSCGAELKTCDEVDFSGSVTGISTVLKCQGCGRLIPR